MYGDKVRGEIAGDLIQSTYFDALQDQDLKPAGHPHIHDSMMPKVLNILPSLKFIQKFLLMALNN